MSDMTPATQFDEDWFASTDEIAAARRRRSAHSVETPDWVLRRLLDDPHKDMHYWIGENHATPADVLRELAESERLAVRHAVADNMCTPADVLEKLARDEYVSVRHAVAKNTASTGAVLSILVEEVKRGVAAADGVGTPAHIGILASILADNPNADAHVLNELKDLGDVNMQRCVVSHPHVTEDILADLATSLNPRLLTEVAWRTKRPESLDTLSQRMEFDVRAVVVRNPHTSGETLTAMSTSNSSVIRQGVASHRNTPVETLEKLASDPVVAVRKAVFTNVNYG